MTPHTDTEPPAGRSVKVHAAIEANVAVLSFVVSGTPPFVPVRKFPCRADELWRTTCFEMFIRPLAGDGYFEFNFSPSQEWAAYVFHGYREGASNWPLSSTPLIEPIEDGIRVSLALSGLPPQPWRVGLSAVIEEIDGTKSYWALAHAPGPPDFHHRDCFVAHVPASEI